MLKRSPRWLAVLLPVLALFASAPLHASESAMFEKKRTYCFGRYLVDIPVEAVLVDGGNEYLGTSIEADKVGMRSTSASTNAVRY